MAGWFLCRSPVHRAISWVEIALWTGLLHILLSASCSGFFRRLHLIARIFHQKVLQLSSCSRSSPDVSWICAVIAQDIGLFSPSMGFPPSGLSRKSIPDGLFTRKFLKESRIGDYERLKKYFLWNQETSKHSVNLWNIRASHTNCSQSPHSLPTACS